MFDTETLSVPLVDVALKYRDSGLSVIATRQDKRPVASWKPYQTALATDEQIGTMFFDPDNAHGVALICGAVSGGLECIDFDDGGSAWSGWAGMVNEDCPGLLERLPVEVSPSGGHHVFYRIPDKVPGNSRLAGRASPDGGQTVLIETRGEGGYVVVAPTPGYELIDGDFENVPTIAAEEHETLIRLARALNELPVEAVSRPADERGKPEVSGRPGDDFKRRGDIRALLHRHGWQYVRTIGPNEQWRRPGKNKGISATLRSIDGVEVFFPFTSSSTFEPMRGYDPFQIYAVLEHGGDHAGAASALRREGFGGNEKAGALPHESKDAADVKPELEVKDAATWIFEQIPESEPIITGVFDVGDKCFLIGGSKGRKSFFTMQAALSIAAGKDFLGFHVPKARRVAIAQFEIREHHYQRRLSRMATAMWVDPREFPGGLSVLNLRGKAATLESLGNSLKALRPELLIIDPWYKLYGQGHDENSAGDAASLLAKVDKLAEELGAAIWVVHHDTKMGSELKATARGAGSGLVSRDYDSALLLTPHASEPDAIVMSAVLRNYPPMPETSIRWNDNRFVEAPDVLPTPETPATRRVQSQRGPSDDDIIEVVAGWFKGEPLASLALQSRIQKTFGIGKNSAREIVSMMLASGKYERRVNPQTLQREIWAVNSGFSTQEYSTGVEN